MSGPKVGDRVRVRKFEATVYEEDFCIFGERGLIVTLDDGERFWIPASRVEVLRPPVRVGDVIDTAEQLDALPGSTVIVPIDTTCAALQKGFIAEWWRSNNSKQAVHARAVTLPATVVYLPDGAA